MLHRHGLVARLGKRRSRAQGTPLSAGNKPNDLWCADFKGEFRLGNSSYCYPLTVTDHASRYLLLCEALASVREDPAIAAFHRLFAERGLPDAIRSVLIRDARRLRFVAGGQWRALSAAAAFAEAGDEAVAIEHGVDGALDGDAQVAGQAADEEFADLAGAPVGFAALEADVQALDQ